MWARHTVIQGDPSKPKGVKYSDKLLRLSQGKYPDKAGITQLHHIIPIYLGGARNGARIELDAAYHQLITNEFFK
jgi:hypothetical protein